MRPVAEGVDYMLTEKDDSTPGFPWNTRFKLKGDVDRELLCSYVQFVLDNPHIDVDYIFHLFFKDELIKRAKAAEGRFRMICGAPIDFAVLQYLVGFEWHKRRQEIFELTPYKCGMNVFSDQWNRLGRRHSKYRYHMEFDLSGAEFNFQTWCFDFIGELRKEHMEESVHPLIDFITRALKNKYVRALDGTIEMCPTLNPSGHFDTTVYTDIVTHVFFMSYFASLGIELDVQFISSLALSIYGDNALFSYGDDFVENGLSLASMQEFAGKFGMNFKATIVEDFSKARFLSAGWRDFNGRYYMFSDHVEKLLLSSQYTKFRTDVAEKHAGKLYSISGLLLFHPDESVYSDFQAIVNKFMCGRGTNLPLDSHWRVRMRWICDVPVYKQRVFASGLEVSAPAGVLDAARLPSALPVSEYAGLKFLNA